MRTKLSFRKAKELPENHKNHAASSTKVATKPAGHGAQALPNRQLEVQAKILLKKYQRP